jgi:hypothetical protein
MPSCPPTAMSRFTFCRQRRSQKGPLSSGVMQHFAPTLSKTPSTAMGAMGALPVALDTSLKLDPVPWEWRSRRTRMICETHGPLLWLPGAGKIPPAHQDCAAQLLSSYPPPNAFEGSPVAHVEGDAAADSRSHWIAVFAQPLVRARTFSK